MLVQDYSLISTFEGDDAANQDTSLEGSLSCTVRKNTLACTLPSMSVSVASLSHNWAPLSATPTGLFSPDKVASRSSS